MFWNKKETKGLPDLPPMRAFPSNQESGRFPTAPKFNDNIPTQDDEDNSEKHPLPSFPDSPMSKGFSQAAIKDAISTDEEMPQDPQLSPRAFKTVEMEEWTPEQPGMTTQIEAPTQKAETQTIPTMPTVPKMNSKVMSSKPIDKNQDLFIKLEKFHTARRALEEAKTKLESMDELLKKIRETKLREEQELSSWEKELITIKSRVQEVNDGVFGKVD